MNILTLVLIITLLIMFVVWALRKYFLLNDVEEIITGSAVRGDLGKKKGCLSGSYYIIVEDNGCYHVIFKCGLNGSKSYSKYIRDRLWDIVHDSTNETSICELDYHSVNSFRLKHIPTENKPNANDMATDATNVLTCINTITQNLSQNHQRIHPLDIKDIIEAELRDQEMPNLLDIFAHANDNGFQQLSRLKGSMIEVIGANLEFYQKSELKNDFQNLIEETFLNIFDAYTNGENKKVIRNSAEYIASFMANTLPNIREQEEEFLNSERQRNIIKLRNYLSRKGAIQTMPNPSANLLSSDNIIILDDVMKIVIDIYEQFFQNEQEEESFDKMIYLQNGLYDIYFAFSETISDNFKEEILRIANIIQNTDNHNPQAFEFFLSDGLGCGEAIMHDLLKHFAEIMFNNLGTNFPNLNIRVIRGSGPNGESGLSDGNKHILDWFYTNEYEGEVVEIIICPGQNQQNYPVNFLDTLFAEADQVINNVANALNNVFGTVNTGDQQQMTDDAHNRREQLMTEIVAYASGNNPGPLMLALPYANKFTFNTKTWESLLDRRNIKNTKRLNEIEKQYLNAVPR